MFPRILAVALIAMSAACASKPPLARPPRVLASGIPSHAVQVDLEVSLFVPRYWHAKSLGGVLERALHAEVERSLSKVGVIPRCEEHGRGSSRQAVPTDVLIRVRGSVKDDVSNLTAVTVLEIVEHGRVVATFTTHSPSSQGAVNATSYPRMAAVSLVNQAVWSDAWRSTFRR